MNDRLPTSPLVSASSTLAVLAILVLGVSACLSDPADLRLDNDEDPPLSNQDDTRDTGGDDHDIGDPPEDAGDDPVDVDTEENNGQPSTENQNTGENGGDDDDDDDDLNAGENGNNGGEPDDDNGDDDGDDDTEDEPSCEDFFDNLVAPGGFEGPFIGHENLRIIGETGYNYLTVGGLTADAGIVQIIPKESGGMCLTEISGSTCRDGGNTHFHICNHEEFEADTTYCAIFYVDPTAASGGTSAGYVEFTVDNTSQSPSCRSLPCSNFLTDGPIVGVDFDSYCDTCEESCTESSGS